MSLHEQCCRALDVDSVVERAHGGSPMLHV